jgi:hypothetical protein
MTNNKPPIDRFVVVAGFGGFSHVRSGVLHSVERMKEIERRLR